MSKDANSFGHDKALAWESRGFVYTKRGCIVSTHPLSDIRIDVLSYKEQLTILRQSPHLVIYDKFKLVDVITYLL